MSIKARYRLDHAGFALEVDLSLPGQGVTALFGPSGSGKTTLLRCIAGLDRAKGFLSVKGEVWQDEQTGRFLPAHERALGYVFQEANLFPHLSVEGNLDFSLKRAASPSGVTSRQLDRRHLVELLGIAHLLKRRPDTLSGGEKQRVAIARALFASPRLLLMDEPLAALDMARKQEFLPYLEHLRDELEIPVIYVSHAADEVARLADHIVLMDAGRAVAEGPLSETLARLDLPINLGEDAGVVLDGVLAQRDEAWQLARVDFPGGSLWVREHGVPPGARVRVRVLARDVSLALEQPERTSIQNLLPGMVEAIGNDHHPALALIRVRVGESALIARLTQRSVATLNLAPGSAVWAQVKSVALIG